MIRTHKIRLEPNNVQDNYMLRACGTARHAYNQSLAWWSSEYEKYKLGERRKPPTTFEARKELRVLKNREFTWYNEVTNNSYENAVRDLGIAFSRFFKKKSKYPKFKSRHKADLSFRIDSVKLKINDERIYISKLGWVKMSEKLRFQGKVLDSTISHHAGHWYISIPVELNEPIVRTPTKEPVGVDVGVREYVLSNGTRSEVPRAYRKAERNLRRAQQDLSRKAKGSKNREKAKLKVQKKHEKIANIRKDWLHKLTTDLAKYEYVAIEDLNVAGMVKNHRLAKSISDAAFGTFRSMLEYKTDVVTVDRFFPSSKLCNVCGIVRTKLPLNIRTWVCDCGMAHDRDLNAARNILAESINILNAGKSSVSACGEFLTSAESCDIIKSQEEVSNLYETGTG